MNYEDFSSNARKTIDQIQQIFNDIKERKVTEYKMGYWNIRSPENKDNVRWMPGDGLCFERVKYWIPYRDFISGIIVLNGVLTEEEKIWDFIERKNYFFPIIDSNLSLKELAKQYPFIAQ